MHSRESVWRIGVDIVAGRAGTKYLERGCGDDVLSGISLVNEIHGGVAVDLAGPRSGGSRNEMIRAPGRVSACLINQVLR